MTVKLSLFVCYAAHSLIYHSIMNEREWFGGRVGAEWLGYELVMCAERVRSMNEILGGRRGRERPFDRVPFVCRLAIRAGCHA